MENNKDSIVICPGAQVLGNVELGENVSIWHGAVVRGDTDSITIGNNSNVQDNCVIHCTKGFPVVIGDNVSVGHGAVVHGCRLDDNVLIGMNAPKRSAHFQKLNCRCGRRCKRRQGISRRQSDFRSSRPCGQAAHRRAD